MECITAAEVFVNLHFQSETNKHPNQNGQDVKQ